MTVNRPALRQLRLTMLWAVLYVVQASVAPYEVRAVQADLEAAQRARFAELERRVAELEGES